MACTTLFPSPLTMAATEFTRALRFDAAHDQPFEVAAERTPLRMNWVVIIDRNGNPKLQINWTPSPDLG